MIKPANYLKYSALLLPIVFIFVGINFNRARYVNDPNYIYLMNALCICNGKSVGTTDNPGTTVMQTGAATMAIMHLFSNQKKESLTSHVIHDPEKFVEGIRIVIVVLNSLILFLLGWIAIKRTSSVWLALLLQISTLLSSNTLDHIWTKLSPEPLLFLITGIYVLAILFYYTEENKNQWKYVLIFALITGAGLGTKATFLPLIVFPVLVFPSFKMKFGYLLGLIPSFVLFTIPAIPEYKSMYFWFRNLIRYSGIYGHGEKGIIDTKTYLPNIIKILENNATIAFVIAGGIVVLCIGFWQRKNKEIYWDVKFLFGLVGTFIFGTLLVAKHYKGDHYLIPVLLLFGIAIYFIINIISVFFHSDKLKAILLAISAIILIGYVGWQQPRILYKTNSQFKVVNLEIESTNQLMNHYYADYTRINYYIFSLNKYTGLKFGDDFAQQKLLPYLMDIYPHTYFYEFSSNQFLNWNQQIQLNDIVELFGNKILLVNGPADKGTLEEISKRGFPLIKVYEGSAQNLYILDTLNYTPAVQEDIIPIEKQ